MAQRNAPPRGSSDAASRTLTGRGSLGTGKSLSFVSAQTGSEAPQPSLALHVETFVHTMTL